MIRFRNRLVIYISTTLSLILFLVFAVIVQNTISENRDDFEQSEMIRILDIVNDRIFLLSHDIYSITGFVESQIDSGIDYDELDIFAQGIILEEDAIINFSVSPNGIQDYVYPLVGNEDVLGHNLLTDEREDVQLAVSNAIETKSLQVSGPYPMRQDPTKSILVFRKAVFYSDESFFGLVNIVIETDTVFIPSLEDAKYKDVFNYEIVDNKGEKIFGNISEVIHQRELINYGLEWTINYEFNLDYLERINAANRILDYIFFVAVSIVIVVTVILAVLIRRQNKIITRMLFNDELTKIYNRRYFDSEIVRMDDKKMYPLSIVVGDVNGLKLVNDTFGHETGDKLLANIADTLKQQSREKDVVCRWGGDEFVILMPYTTEREASELISGFEKKLEGLKSKFGEVSVAFGLDTKIDDKKDIDKIFSFAEELMYSKKIQMSHSSRGETINTILNTLFEKSSMIREHSDRVAELSVRLSEALGQSKTEIEKIKTTGAMHDIGKIIIDLSILDKPEPLSEREYEIVKHHPVSGSRMLVASKEYEELAQCVLHHHEKWDGSGYPLGLSGTDIPLQSRIIAIADAFDAMTSERPYRKSREVSDAIGELIKCKGSHFDPELVDIFVEKVLGLHVQKTSK